MKRLGAAAAVGLVLAHAAAFALVVRHGAAPTRRARLRAKACLLFIEAAPEERCLAEGLYPDVARLRERAAALDRLGYLRPPLVRDKHLRALADAGSGCTKGYGSFELTPAGGGGYVASGRARLPHRGGEPADAVVLAYGLSEDEQAAFALAPVGAGAAPGDDEEAAAWRRTFPADGRAAEGLTAWAFDAAGGKAYRLCREGAAN